MKYIILLVAVLFISCNNQENNKEQSQTDEIPAKSLTLWTGKTELFVEFPALIVGHSSRFAAHFTVLEGHQPVRKGSVTVSLIKGDKGIRNMVQSPSSPGIFSPTLQPKKAGNYKMVFDIKTPNYNDQLIIHDIIVYPTKEAAISALGTDSESGGISFLKEQAWKLEFQTQPVIKGEIYDVINTSGIWNPSPSSVKSLVAKANGTVDFAIKNLTEGTTVKKGQLLMNLSSKGLSLNNLETTIVNLKATYEQLKSEYLRKKELYESKIVSKSEFEKVESKYLVAKSNFESISSGVSGSGKQIRAPFDGYVKSINVSNGDYVTQGKTLIVLGANQSTMLEAHINPSYKLTKENIHSIWYHDSNGDWINVIETGGSVLSIGKDVSLENPFISVFTQVNKKVDMAIGSVTEVQIALGSANQSILIPESALLEDYGRFSVVLQLTGESFERRPVNIGKRNGKNVEILSGLEVGDVVVAKGAYQVKMASMSGSTPAHGHEH